MECWWVQPSSHDGSVHAHSREVGSRNAVDGCRLGLRRDEGFVVGIWEDADVQSQIDRIVMNKAIYQKVATAMAELGYSCMWRCAKLPVAQCHEHRHENEIHLFSPCHMTVTCIQKIWLGVKLRVSKMYGGGKGVDDVLTLQKSRGAKAPLAPHPLNAALYAAFHLFYEKKQKMECYDDF